MWSANLAELGPSVRQVDKYCDSYHFDIMDGHYTSNLLFGPDTIKALRIYTDKPFQVHLMLKHPQNFLEQFIEAGADIFIFHKETCEDIYDIISNLKSMDKKIGIALRCEEEYSEVMEFLNLIDYLIVMGTKIGIKGVSIEPQTYKKIDTLKQYIEKNNYPVEIQIDGGIRTNTVPKLFECGADIITAGSLLFNNSCEQIYNWVQDLSK